MSIEITRRICLDPVCLDQNILEHLFDKIRESTENECTKEYGYILSVDRLVEIKDNYVSAANSDIVFEVSFEAQTLKPDIGTKLTGVVCMVVKHGVFLSVRDKMKVLVPMTGYNFDSENNCYTKDDVIIQNGDILSVQIVGSKYSKQSFSCYGSLIEE